MTTRAPAVLKTMSSQDTKVTTEAESEKKIKLAQQCVDETKCNIMSYVYLLTIEHGFSFSKTKFDMLPIVQECPLSKGLLCSHYIFHGIALLRLG